MVRVVAVDVYKSVLTLAGRLVWCPGLQRVMVPWSSRPGEAFAQKNPFVQEAKDVRTAGTCGLGRHSLLTVVAIFILTSKTQRRCSDFP